MAETLSIKPILTVSDGKLELLERVRTRKKAVERTLELVGQALQGKPIERLAILHTHALEQAREFEQQVLARHPCPTPVITAEFTPGLSVHAGPGVVGVVILAGK